jgi:hypothetical protein
MSFEKPPTPLSSMSITICSKPFVKHLSGVDVTPRFSKTFSRKLFECSHPRVFLAPLEGFQGLVANQQATTARISSR